MNTHVEASGYDLYDAGDCWLLCAGERVLSAGRFRTVVQYAIGVLKFKPEEIDVAVTLMVRENYNAAHFGAFKSFIGPHNKEFKALNGKKTG